MQDKKDRITNLCKRSKKKNRLIPQQEQVKLDCKKFIYIGINRNTKKLRGWLDCKKKKVQKGQNETIAKDKKKLKIEMQKRGKKDELDPWHTHQFKRKTPLPACVPVPLPALTCVPLPVTRIIVYLVPFPETMIEQH